MSNDQKRDAIIEAAIKRFAHFGVSKTTMAEIAADLSISKASLYYYFPDKRNLYAEVLKSITQVEDDHELRNELDPFNAIRLYLQHRTDFILRYHNILEFLKTFSSTNMPDELQPLFTHLRKKELQRITSIIEKGVDSGLFQIRDSKKTAEMFFDLLDGLRALYKKNNPGFFPDKKQFQALNKRELEFAEIFFNGLTIKKQG